MAYIAIVRLSERLYCLNTCYECNFMVILLLLVQQSLISIYHMTRTMLIILPLLFHLVSTQIYAVCGIVKILALYVNK